MAPSRRSSPAGSSDAYRLIQTTSHGLRRRWSPSSRTVSQWIDSSIGSIDSSVNSKGIREWFRKRKATVGISGLSFQSTELESCMRARLLLFGLLLGLMALLPAAVHAAVPAAGTVSQATPTS